MYVAVLTMRSGRVDAMTRLPADILDDLQRHLMGPATPETVRALRELPQELAVALRGQLVETVLQLRDQGMTMSEVADQSGIPRSTLSALMSTDTRRNLPPDASARGYGLGLKEASRQLGIKETRWRARIARSGGAELIEGSDVTLRRLEQGWRAWRPSDPVAPDVLRAVDLRIQAERMAEIKEQMGEASGGPLLDALLVLRATL